MTSVRKSYISKSVPKIENYYLLKSLEISWPWTNNLKESYHHLHVTYSCPPHSTLPLQPQLMTLKDPPPLYSSKFCKYDNYDKATYIAFSNH